MGLEDTAAGLLSLSPADGLAWPDHLACGDRPVLCIGGCSAASLVSSHWMPQASAPSVTTESGPRHRQTLQSGWGEAPSSDVGNVVTLVLAQSRGTRERGGGSGRGAGHSARGPKRHHVSPGSVEGHCRAQRHVLQSAPCVTPSPTVTPLPPPRDAVTQAQRGLRPSSRHSVQLWKISPRKPPLVSASTGFVHSTLSFCIQFFLKLASKVPEVTTGDCFRDGRRPRDNKFCRSFWNLVVVFLPALIDGGDNTEISVLAVFLPTGSSGYRGAGTQFKQT